MSKQNNVANCTTTNGRVHLKIIERVLEIPLVNSIWELASTRYDALKRGNRLAGRALGTAEKLIQLWFAITVVPMLKVMRLPISYADNLAVSSFDYFKPKIVPLYEAYLPMARHALKLVRQIKAEFYDARNRVIQWIQSKVEFVFSLPSRMISSLNSNLNATVKHPQENGASYQTANSSN